MDTKVLDRVRKLLELAKSDNVNEASNAAKQAQVLMSKHAITQAMVDVSDDEPDEDIENDVLHEHSSSKLPNWKGQLAMVMCEVNQCKTWRDGGRLNIIGRPSDANTVRYLYSYVVREIDRLASEEAALRNNPGRTWVNNFRLGAVSEVNKRLREAAAEARKAMKQDAANNDTLGNGTALVRVNNALAKLDERSDAVEQYGKTHFRLRKGSRSRSKYDGSGREAGRRAGASINLNGGGRAGLGSGSKGALTG